MAAYAAVTIAHYIRQMTAVLLDPRGAEAHVDVPCETYPDIPYRVSAHAHAAAAVGTLTDALCSRAARREDYARRGVAMALAVKDALSA